MTWSFDDLCHDCDHRRGAHVYDHVPPVAPVCRVPGCRCTVFRTPGRIPKRATPEEMKVLTAAFEREQAEWEAQQGETE